MKRSKNPIIVHMDGIHDDTEAIQAAIDGKEVRWSDGRIWKYSVEPSSELPNK